MIENDTSENLRENVAQPVQLDPPVRFELFLILVKVLIAVMFMFPLAHYSMNGENRNKENEAVSINQTENPNGSRTDSNDTELTQNNNNILLKRREFVPPSCPISYLESILREICEDYVFRSTTCTSEDINNLKKHKIPVNSARKSVNSDPRTNIVSFLTAGFLIVSLIAAFMELYKAKKQTPAKNKAPLTRKCSLADLTVLKHHRKEMIRRDSILEGNEQPDIPINKKPPPLQRSSSTPVDPIGGITSYTFNRSFDSRRNSVADNNNPNVSRSTPDGRRLSIMDRKSSINEGKFVDRYDSSGRRISVDVNINGSPERKHYSRLVHRH